MTRPTALIVAIAGVLAMACAGCEPAPGGTAEALLARDTRGALIMQRVERKVDSLRVELRAARVADAQASAERGVGVELMAREALKDSASIGGALGNVYTMPDGRRIFVVAGPR